MKTDGKDQAFAMQAFVDKGAYYAPEAGLTKREYFAAMAVSNAARVLPPKAAAILAVEYSDALIEALNKKQEPATDPSRDRGHFDFNHGESDALTDGRVYKCIRCNGKKDFGHFYCGPCTAAIDNGAPTLTRNE